MPETIKEKGVKIPDRLKYFQIAPEMMQGLMENEKILNETGVLEESLRELVKMRASQLNGCAYCLDMHTKDAMKEGETVQRLVGLDAWRESPYYTARERAALEWAEAVTLVSTSHVEDEVYERVKKEFTDKEMVALTLAVVAINCWNRFAIAFRTIAGQYQPK